MLVLFLDESGDHSLDKIDRQYPMFVLAGCVLKESYHNRIAQKKVDDFKKQLFGSSKIILHTSDIARNRAGFEKLKETEFRDHFYNELNELMRNLEYTVIACAIKKDEHLEKYGLAAVDPYMLSLDCVVERFVFMLREQRQNGVIIAESRNDVLDNQLELAFLNLKISGTFYVGASEIKHRITNLVIRGKDENIAGLQIADLVASPIGRFVLGRKTHEDFRIIEQKFRKCGSDYKGFGLVVLPKE